MAQAAAVPQTMEQQIAAFDNEIATVSGDLRAVEEELRQTMTPAQIANNKGVILLTERLHDLNVRRERLLPLPAQPAQQTGPPLERNQQQTATPAQVIVRRDSGASFVLELAPPRVVFVWKRSMDDKFLPGFKTKCAEILRNHVQHGVAGNVKHTLVYDKKQAVTMKVWGEPHGLDLVTAELNKHSFCNMYGQYVDCTSGSMTYDGEFHNDNDVVILPSDNKLHSVGSGAGEPDVRVSPMSSPNERTKVKVSNRVTRYVASKTMDAVAPVVEQASEHASEIASHVSSEIGLIKNELTLLRDRLQPSQSGFNILIVERATNACEVCGVPRDLQLWPIKNIVWDVLRIFRLVGVRSDAVTLQAYAGTQLLMLDDPISKVHAVYFDVQK